MYDLNELTEVMESALAPLRQIPQSIKEMGDTLKSLFQNLTRAIESMASKFIDIVQSGAIGSGLLPSSYKRFHPHMGMFAPVPGGSIKGYKQYLSVKAEHEETLRLPATMDNMLKRAQAQQALVKLGDKKQFTVFDMFADVGHSSKAASYAFAAGNLAIGGLAAALAAATAAAVAFAERMRATATSLTQGGGSLRDYGSLRMLQGLGIDGSRAQSFGNMLNQGGLAAGLAARIGIRPYGGLGGDQNSILKIHAAVKHILNTKSDQEAGIYARAFGLEDITYARYASKDSKARLLADYGSTSSKDMREAADAQIEYMLAMRELSQIVTDIGRKALPILNAALKNLDIVFTVLGAAVGGILAGPVGALGGALAGVAIGNHFTNFSNLEKAVNGNSDALNRNTQALDTLTQMQNGSYGGGQRLRSAIPAAWGPLHIENQTRGLGLMLGAYSV